MSIDNAYIQAQVYIRNFLNEDRFMGASIEITQMIQKNTIKGLFGVQSEAAVIQIKQFSNFSALVNPHTILNFARELAVAELGGRLVLGAFATVVKHPLIKILIGKILGKSPVTTELNLYFHATAKSGANSIKDIGIDLSKGRLNLDFNTKSRGAFYLSESIENTRILAKRIPAIFGEQSEIITFSIPKNEISGLKIKLFQSGDIEWANFVTSARKGTLVHDYDIVIGPKLANPDQVLKGLSKPKALNQIQFVLTSEKSAKIFSKYIKK